MFEQFKKHIYSSEPFRALEKISSSLTPEHPVALRGMSGSLLAFFAARLFEQRHRQLLVIVPETDRAEQLRDDCSALLPEQPIHCYAMPPVHAGVQLDVSASIAQIETLRALSAGETVLVVASAEALAGKIPPPGEFSQRTLNLSRKKDYPFEELLVSLDALGFEKKDFVEEYGDFAVRGGILDIFPFVGDNPIRIEFWGDTIESIREFDVVSQRSIRELQEATIVADLQKDTTGDDSQNSTAEKRASSLFDYLQSDAMLILEEPELCHASIDELQEEGHANIFDWQHLEDHIAAFPRFIHSFLHAHESAIDFHSTAQPPTGGSVKRWIEHVRSLHQQQYDVYLACDSHEEVSRLQELVEEEITAPDASAHDSSSADGGYHSQQTSNEDIVRSVHYHVLYEAIHAGFIFHAAHIAVFTEHEIFGRLKRRGAGRRRKFKGFSQKELQQLQRGDYVVHQDYGIGKFVGLQKIKLRGVETEVMKLVYEGSDTLYVNLNFLNRVQKYSSQEGHVPKLGKLGGPDWERLKNRARKKIKDIARDLIKLYARRKHEQGFVFAPDTHWQKEMEASFQYEDTPDQAASSRAVKADMERASPMDRLICGDVGFGKTEIAVRAAFKAVMNGKQVAVLVPTTILAQQHFNTFMDRVGRYSVRVESISRFRTKKDQTAVLQELKSGKVDILVGTHRLLSKDVVFKDLGLLIIDEEHRFGVAAKEKLRQLRAAIDTLTLTATPIPRTLQFSLMGARDLSLINTPPRNRLPIQTEIAQFDFQLIREAIMKELHRGGQVFFVHDRVQNIEQLQVELEQHVPKARFGVAHGQMHGHQLEKTMLDFLEKKFDVLLCTKIIESGIDIPSVNTMIISRADHFGMAELYQLRGRVGRSNIQAFAYLLTPPLSVLPRQTLRRLQAIQEFTELGSGFNLAMRDLEIRGAGNLLGGEQSGFILEMGFEMYQRIVEDAVRELKENEFAELIQEKSESGTPKPETVIESDIEAFIPDIYVESDAERLDIYRRLYRCMTLDEVNTFREELHDRFGDYPEEVEALFQLVEIKILAAHAGFIKVEIHADRLTLSFPSPDEKSFYEGDDAPFQHIVQRIRNIPQYHPRLNQHQHDLSLTAHISTAGNDQERLSLFKIFFADLAK